MRASGLGEYIRVEPGDFTEDAGDRATVRLLNSDHPPTAIFVHSLRWVKFKINIPNGCGACLSNRPLQIPGGTGCPTGSR